VTLRQERFFADPDIKALAHFLSHLK